MKSEVLLIAIGDHQGESPPRRTETLPLHYYEPLVLTSGQRAVANLGVHISKLCIVRESTTEGGSGSMAD